MNILRLKALLSDKNITGVQLAQMVEVSKTTISHIAQNKTFPKPELLLKIAEALDVDVRDLFNPTKQVNPKDRLNSIILELEDLKNELD